MPQLHIIQRSMNITLLSPLRSLILRLGLADLWIRQLRSGNCHHPTGATKFSLQCRGTQQQQTPSVRKA